jgi:hypothetical protein
MAMVGNKQLKIMPNSQMGKKPNKGQILKENKKI